MNTSSAGFDFIKSWEGYRDMPYSDAGGNDTIGYGHLIKPDEHDLLNGVDNSQADALLHNDVAIAESAVNDTINVPLAQQQFDALVSYAYNIGTGAFRGGDLTKLINAKASNDEIEKFWVSHYITSKGQFVSGLADRRQAEADFFLQKNPVTSAIARNPVKTLLFVVISIAIVMLIIKY